MPLGLSQRNVQILENSHVAYPTSALVETFLTSTRIPGGTIGNNGYLKITSFWNKTGIVAASGTIRFGNTNDLAGSPICAISIAVGAFQGIIQTHLLNANSQLIQHSSVVSVTGTPATSGYVLSSLAEATYAVDTSIDSYLVFSGSITDALQTLTFDGYSIELLK